MKESLPDLLALASMAIHTAPYGAITIRPHGHVRDGGTTPLLPVHLVLSPEQARQLAADLIEALGQSAEDAKATRN